MSNFDLICRLKDVSASNLNEVFESYGCSTLEAKVPIVDTRVAEKVQNSNYETQRHETLAFKGESGRNAVEGRIPRTRDRPLTLVEIGKDTIIAAGKQREKSPVDRDELDEELEEYMRKTAELKAQRVKARQERQEMATNDRAIVLPEATAMITQEIDPNWN